MIVIRNWIGIGSVVAGLCLLQACTATSGSNPVAVSGGNEKAPVSSNGFINLSSLQNRNARTLLDQIGKPNFQRKEGDSQMWQYQGRSCVVDFYLEQDKADLTVVYIEPRTKPGYTNADLKNCLPANS